MKLINPLKNQFVKNGIVLSKLAQKYKKKVRIIETYIQYIIAM